MTLLPDWIDDVRRARSPGRLGAAASIDPAARRRGVAAVVEGRSLGLSRPVQSAAHAPADRPSAYSLTATFRREERLVVARDRLTVDNHGMVNTHIDGLNHFGLDETWHDGSAAEVGPTAPCIADWAETGLVTRAVLLDIPAVRGTPWVAGGTPVGAADLEAAIRAAGTRLERGDALLLYMGRDRHEREGRPYEVVGSYSEVRPGIGRDGARWLASQDVSLLLWDFMEACGPGESPYTVHALIWAMGLVIVDNCDLAPAREALAARSVKAGLLAVAPLRLPTGTGCLVNPLLVI